MSTLTCAVCSVRRRLHLRPLWTFIYSGSSCCWKAQWGSVTQRQAQEVAELVPEVERIVSSCLYLRERDIGSQDERLWCSDGCRINYTKIWTHNHAWSKDEWIHSASSHVCFVAQISTFFHLICLLFLFFSVITNSVSCRPIISKCEICKADLKSSSMW